MPTYISWQHFRYLNSLQRQFALLDKVPGTLNPRWIPKQLWHIETKPSLIGISQLQDMHSTECLQDGICFLVHITYWQQHKSIIPGMFYFTGYLSKHKNIKPLKNLIVYHKRNINFDNSLRSSEGKELKRSFPVPFESRKW